MNKLRINSYCFLVLFSCISFAGLAQTDVEFWFAVPEVTVSHCGGSPSTCPGGEPVYFRVSAMDLPSTVRIYQPLRLNGLDTTFTVQANSTVSIDATNWISDLENEVPGIVENKGVHILSNNFITVYYDEDEFYNQDIFALKGKNALGRDFFTPFNNQWANGNYNPIKPYSSIDIVATEDNTTVTVTPTATVVGGPPIPGIPFIISLNRGETYSIKATSQAAAGHLGGTKIHSDKPIAVTIKDDSVMGNVCRDLIGDQTVPILRADGTRIVGYEYIVMRGKINLINPNASPPDPVGTMTGERIYIMAVEPNTQIFIDGILETTLVNTGDQYDYQLSKNSAHVRGSEPIMVLHVAGFGCEFGGAVLPTIDGCTGSLEVSFTRSTDRSFFLNLMTIEAAQDAFTMHYEDGTTFDIPGGWFEKVEGSDFVCLKNVNKDFPNYSGSIAGKAGVPQGQVVKITNSVHVFHLGLIEGGTTTGCKYGYFSDYAESQGGVVVVETGSQSIFRCFGDTAQLRATGGLSYEWEPADYLDDAFIATPKASPPPGIHNYTVTIHTACFGDKKFTVIVGIAPQVEAFFEMDKWYICAPDTVSFDNQSTGADMSSNANVQWDFDLNDPGNPLLKDTTLAQQHIFTNTSDSVMKKSVQLIVWNDQGCASEFRRDIIIRPEINAGLATDVNSGCHPLRVNFTNTSTGNTEKFRWTLGDGSSSIATSPSHTYLNQGMSNSNFHVKMVATSPFFCTDTIETDISVYPYLEAGFAVDTFRGCSPLLLGIDNYSAGYIEEYEWTFGDGQSSGSSAANLSHNYINPTASTVQWPMKLVVKNTAETCTDTLTRLITVYPGITAGFTQDATSGCHGFDVGFTNQSAATATYFDWDFGDGGSSSQSNPVHEFENIKLSSTGYKVRLVSTTPELCRDTAYQTITVFPYINSDFSVSDFQGCAPFQVTANNASAGAVSQSKWSWGDGTAAFISADTSLTNTYQNNGAAPLVNSLQLVVENEDGCTDTMIRKITVHPVVVSQFSVDATEGCNPLQVRFTNGSNSNAASFMWEFGDGGSSGLKDPGHNFLNLDSINESYTTKLIALSDFNCSDTSEVEITVYSYLEADFTLDQSSSCTPYDASFTNSSTGGVRYEWDFGDGNSHIVFNRDPAQNQYNNPSPVNTVTYQAVLTAYNAENCPSEIRRDVKVYPVVNAIFSADITLGCHPLDVDFTNISTGASSYSWDFANGLSSTAKDPGMTFYNFGKDDTTYYVSLSSTNKLSCTDTQTVGITVHPYVEADFSVTYPTQCTPLEATIFNSSVNGQQFDWDFNETQYSTGSNATLKRTFLNNNLTDSETISIGLLVTSKEACTAHLTRNIEVFHDVVASFSHITEGCQPLMVSFTNTSGGDMEYNWEFGDQGSSILPDPLHKYINPGSTDSVYHVSLIATSDDQCRDTAYSMVTVHPKPRAKFTVSSSVACPPMVLNIQNETENGNIYRWFFGDGTADTTTNLNPVSNTYYNDQESTLTYILKLEVESDQGCMDNTSQNIDVYPSTEVDFERDSSGCSPYLSGFRNNSLRAQTYLWDFDDGTSSLLVHPAHTYYNNEVNVSVYNVTLTGTSKFGCIDSVVKEVTVYPSPLAEFDATPIYQYYPSATVSLVNETNDGFWDYKWDYGDGTVVNDENPGDYNYSDWGTHNITLTASSDWCSHSVTHWIKIFPAQPIAAFVSDISEGCLPLPVRFTNNSEYGSSYLWDFDDGYTSTDFEPNHTYNDAGLYQVKLTITGEGGTDIHFEEIDVYRLPVVNYKVSPDTVMLPDQPIQCFNFSEYGKSYLWDFGDGNTSVEVEPTHLYEELGMYDITLTVYTEHMCEAILTKPQETTVMGSGKIVYPSAFAPNPSGPTGGWYDETDISNEVFRPYFDGVIEYNLYIYTRWGELIFESHNINQGWDGYYHERRAVEGVYVWVVTGKYTNGHNYRHAGDVTLLKTHK